MSPQCLDNPALSVTKRKVLPRPEFNATGVPLIINPHRRLSKNYGYHNEGEEKHHRAGRHLGKL
jgi:hypothetical protein